MKSRLKGHALIHGGQGVFRCYPDEALCECREHSEPLRTVWARKEWHRRHKAEVLAKMDKVLDSLTDLMQEAADEDPDFCDRLAADNARMMKAAIAGLSSAAEAKKSAE